MDDMFEHYAYINWITIQIWSNATPESSSSTEITVNSNAGSTSQIPQKGAPGDFNKVQAHPLFNVFKFLLLLFSCHIGQVQKPNDKEQTSSIRLLHDSNAHLKV